MLDFALQGKPLRVASLLHCCRNKLPHTHPPKGSKAVAVFPQVICHCPSICYHRLRCQAQTVCFLLRACAKCVKCHTVQLSCIERIYCVYVVALKSFAACTDQQTYTLCCMLIHCWKQALPVLGMILAMISRACLGVVLRRMIGMVNLRTHATTTTITPVRMHSLPLLGCQCYGALCR